MLEIERGRFLTEADNEQYQNYAVLAAETARRSSPTRTRSASRSSSAPTTTRSSASPRSASQLGGIGGSLAAQDFNKDVYIPLNTCRLRFGERIINTAPGSMEAEETQLTQITVQVGTIDEVLPDRPDHRGRGTSPTTPRRTSTSPSPTTCCSRPRRTARQFSIILGTIAAISLLVGGIGIMNIMLATVTERTREIGIRRALGAKRRDITQQFLIETVVLSGVGGMLGVPWASPSPRSSSTSSRDQKAIVTGFSVILAFGISVAIGILFGLYPARRAAMMDPIEALRHE